MAGNADLHAANKAKKDEFYTKLVDIELELRNYRSYFKDKVVLCNCDDPYESNFFKYFALNFNALGLRKLIATCYNGSPIAGGELPLLFELPNVVGNASERCASSERLETFATPSERLETFATPSERLETFTTSSERLETFTTPSERLETFTTPSERLETFATPKKIAYKVEITEVKDYNQDGAVNLSDVQYLIQNDKNVLSLLKGNGDFRSAECVELLKEADIVVTNPPFSLFREFVAQLIEYKKLFLIIGNVNAVTYIPIRSVFA